MFPYTKYSFLWPPRPENPIPNQMIDSYFAKGYVAQVKKNGTNNPIFLGPDYTIFKTRINEDHKNWSPNSDHKMFFKELGTRIGSHNVFCSELIHNKTKTVKNVIFIYDILVYKGMHLVGKTFLERQKILDEIFTKEFGDEYSHTIIGDGVWRAKNFTNNAIWEKLNFEVDEGLVLKNPTSTLKPCYKNGLNSGRLLS